MNRLKKPKAKGQKLIGFGLTRMDRIHNCDSAILATGGEGAAHF
jgi:hypothetical protein